MPLLDPPTPFQDALKLDRSVDGEYTTRFPSSFCFGSRAHGGLLVSLVQRAAALHFQSPTNKPAHPDVLELKMHFLRPVTAGDLSIRLDDVMLGKQTSTIEARVSQGGKLCLMGLVRYATDRFNPFPSNRPGHLRHWLLDLNLHRSMGNFATINGISFPTAWSLSPKLAPASLTLLARDSDPGWLSYQCPWHPESYRRPQSYVKFFVPLHLRDPSFRDSWITPSDPSLVFRNEHLGFVGDMTLPILDNFCDGVGSHTATIAACLEQKRDRQNGTVPVADAESGAFATPLAPVTLSLNMEIKKKLPGGGTRWLFSRCRAREIRNGRMDHEIVILDGEEQLVAVVQQVFQVFDLTKARERKARI
ncbi:MAG: hypothetical protein Q9195_008511 [Heterodermia aff. obscurata]